MFSEYQPLAWQPGLARLQAPQSFQIEMSGNLLLVKGSTTGRVCAWDGDVAMRDRYLTLPPQSCQIKSRTRAIIAQQRQVIFVHITS